MNKNYSSGGGGGRFPGDCCRFPWGWGTKCATKATTILTQGKYMSWEKTTVNKSDIDTIKEMLKEFGVKYKVKVYAYVDDMGAWAVKKIPLRILAYKDKVVIEQIVRTDDCDCDDYIITKKFNIKDFDIKKFNKEEALKNER